MKSLANDLLRIAEGILKDVSLAYPEYGGVARDIERLTLLVKTRGLGCFTLDLPNLDSLLTKGLETGRLALDGPLSRGASRRILVPRLFRGLWLRVFSPNSCLLEDPDINSIFFLRQLCCLGKKVEVGCSMERLKSSIQEYYNVEKQIRRPTLCWESDELDPDERAGDLCFSDLLRDHCWFGESVSWDGSSSRSDNLALRELLRDLQSNADGLAESLGSFDAEEFSELIHREGKGIGFRHGPGAVSDRRGEVHKYDFQSWPDKLHKVFPYHSCGTTASSGMVRPRNHEHASRLIAVPKTAKTPRLIAAESTEHQWCQQLLMRFLGERLKGLFGDNFISFENQDLSRAMALRASLDGRLATVDLSSASDRLSLWVVERLFRRNPSLLRALHSVRTRYIRNEIGYGDEFIKLNKFASQGTAVTFPVQTIAFLVMALTSAGMRINKRRQCEGEKDIPLRSNICVNRHYANPDIARYVNQVRVFGDDIIIPRHGYVVLNTILTELGLKVNHDKSFHVGLFREACGMDAYKGHCVTPVRPRSISTDGPHTRNALLDFSNNLFKKGLWNAAEVVQSIVGKHPFWRLLPIVGLDVGVVGRSSFCGSNYDHLKRRYNVRLHRYEVRRWTFRSISRRKPTNDLPGVLQWFTEAPLPTNKWEHGIQGRSRTSDGLRWEVPY